MKTAINSMRLVSSVRYDRKTLIDEQEQEQEQGDGRLIPARSWFSLRKEQIWY